MNAFQSRKQEISQHTVRGLGSRILLISFFALEENHGGQVKSALKICNYVKILLVVEQTLTLKMKYKNSSSISID